MSRLPVYLRIKPNSPMYGCNLNTYCYLAKVGEQWCLADIEEEQMFEPNTFEVDPDPCGLFSKDKEYLTNELKGSFTFKPAKKVGYIEDGKLYVTKRIKVETGWGGFGPMFPTSFDYIYPNVSKT